MANMFTAPGKRQAFLGVIEAMLQAMRDKKDWRQGQQEEARIADQTRFDRGIARQGIHLQQQGRDIQRETLAQGLKQTQLLEKGRQARWGQASGNTLEQIIAQATQQASGQAFDLKQTLLAGKREDRPLRLPNWLLTGGEFDPNEDLDPRLQLLLAPYISQQGAATRQERGIEADIATAGQQHGYRMTELSVAERGRDRRAAPSLGPSSRPNPNDPNITMTSVNSVINTIIDDLEGGFDTLGNPKPAMPQGPRRRQRESDLAFWLSLRESRGGPPVVTEDDRGGGEDDSIPSQDVIDRIMSGEG